jgi:hypothetical protein
VRPAVEPEVGSGAEPVSSGGADQQVALMSSRIISLPVISFNTPESGAPSARMRRGFLISMMCRWGMERGIAEFSGVSLGLSLWGSREVRLRALLVSCVSRSNILSMAITVRARRLLCCCGL